MLAALALATAIYSCSSNIYAPEFGDIDHVTIKMDEKANYTMDVIVFGEGHKTSTAEYFDDVGFFGYQSEELGISLEFDNPDDSQKAVVRRVADNYKGQLTCREQLNPMSYAEEHSKSYSEGDFGDSSGWQGCYEQGSQADDVKILCKGTTRVLVHGGEEFAVPFTCQYEFGRSGDGLFAVRIATCF